jgi:serine/threonine protein kinase
MARESAMDPLAADDPRQVGVFRLHARLGAGGMGRVYLGYSPGGRAVAVKIVHPELARDPEFMARFRREVQAAEAVSGAYTAPVVGAGPDDSPPWLATAFVPGPSLAELVARAGPLPEAAVWRLAGGLIEALQAIHGRDLVHRDLKPSNILIAVDGPRVIDFGISRAVQGTSVTAAHTTVGTPAYMSPEQAEGREIGPPSDIFSLGSVLASAATGVAPFDGGEMFSIVYRIVHDEADLSRLPPALRSLVGGCLAKDPASRLSLAQLMDAVMAASTSFPKAAPGKFWPDPVEALVAGQESPAPVLVTANGAVPGGAGSAGGAGGQGADVTHTARPAYPPVTPVSPPGPGTVPPRRTRRWLLAAGGAGVLAAAVGATLALVLQSGSSGSTHLAGNTTSSSHSSGARSSTAVSPTAPATTAPPASASAVASPIVVTVCTEPANGCNYAGASQVMEAMPKDISTAGDGSGYVKNLVWSDWGNSRATATGTLEIDNCTPNCAQGTYTGYPAAVTLSGLTPYGSGVEAYSTIVVRAPTAPANEGTYAYTRDTVPS